MSSAIEPFKAKQEVGAQAVCKVCGEVIYDEYRIDNDDGTHTRIVQGFWTQVTNADGTPAGPVQAFCPEHSERIKQCQ